MITLNKDIREDILHYAYNNAIIDFYASNPALKCEVSIMDEILTIYPNSINQFWLNLKFIIKSLAGELGFIDTLNADLETGGVVNFNWNSRGIVNGELKIEVYYKDPETPNDVLTRDLVFINGVLQIEGFRRNFPSETPKERIMLMHPLEKNSIRSSFIRYWEGYPLDFTVYNGDNSGLSVKNINTGQTKVISNVYDVNRVFISDGRTDVGLTEDLILGSGINELLVSSPSDYFTLYLDKIDTCGHNNGHYVKWLNSFGGYSYWFFHKGVRSRSTGNLEDLNNDFNNIEDTISTSISRGKESRDNITVAEYGLSYREQNLLADLYDSPAVFLFTGKPYDRNNFNDWIGIKLRNSNNRIHNAKQKNINFEFNFELPERNMRTL